MEKFVIRGGKALSGDVLIGGAKNAAVAILPATILAADKCLIENLPCISDVMASLQILSELGAGIRMISKNTYEIDTTHIDCTRFPMNFRGRCGQAITFWARCSAGSEPGRWRCPAGATWARGRSISI